MNGNFFDGAFFDGQFFDAFNTGLAPIMDVGKRRRTPAESVREGTEWREYLARIDRLPEEANREPEREAPKQEPVEGPQKIERTPAERAVIVNTLAGFLPKLERSDAPQDYGREIKSRADEAANAIARREETRRLLLVAQEEQDIAFVLMMLAAEGEA